MIAWFVYKVDCLINITSVINESNEKETSIDPADRRLTFETIDFTNAAREAFWDFVVTDFNIWFDLFSIMDNWVRW